MSLLNDNLACMKKQFCSGNTHYIIILKQETFLAFSQEKVLAFSDPRNTKTEKRTDQIFF